MRSLRAQIIRLAHERPDLRPHLLPLVTEGVGHTAATSHLAAKDTAAFVMWALLTQRPLPVDRVITFLERNGVHQSAGTGRTKRGQPIGLGEYVEIQANNAPGDLIDLLQPYHLRRGKVVKVEGEDVVIQFDATNEILRVPGGTTAGQASGVFRASIMENTSGRRHIEAVYLPANERKPTSVSVEVLKQYVDRGLEIGEERSENYFSGFATEWDTSKEGNPYFKLWTQQRSGRPRTLSPAKGQVYYIGLVGRRPGSWQNELDRVLEESLVATP